MRCPVQQMKKTKKIYLTKKLKTNRKKNKTKTKTVRYLSRKKRTKKLMPLKTWKIGSSSSNGVQKRPKNT